jgi:pimeloyl-ACP methyl ester carboxylesterase
METVTSDDGTRIAYEEHGEGPPLILIHGGSSPKVWEPLIPQFDDEYSVIVPHRRGVGHSDDSTEYSLARGVEDISAIIDAVDGKPTLFGHSFGGLLAIEAARLAPVEKLIAYEPAVLVGEYREQATLASQMEALIDDGKRREAMRFYIREVMHGGEIEDLNGWLAEWPPWPEIVAVTENIARINRAIEQYRLPETLAIDAPTLLLTGTQGPPHLKDGILAVDDALTDSQFVELDGVGHGGPTEAPSRVTAEVREFIHTQSTLMPEDSD